MDAPSYRDEWTHLKTSVIYEKNFSPKFAGLHPRKADGGCSRSDIRPGLPSSRSSRRRAFHGRSRAEARAAGASHIRRHARLSHETKKTPFRSLSPQSRREKPIVADEALVEKRAELLLNLCLTRPIAISRAFQAFSDRPTDRPTKRLIELRARD